MAKQPLRIDKTRIELFSDVVIGLVMVSMSLRLRLPDVGADGFSPEEAAPLAWRLGAYAMSYLVLAIMWVNHRQLAASLAEGPMGLQWLNLNLLFWMTLIPVTTAFVGEHWGSPTAIALYAGLFAVTSLSFTALRVWLAKHDADNPALARVHFGVTHKSLAAGLIYAAAAPLAFIHPVAAAACLVIVPLMFLVPQNLGEAA
jgi:uncharacterized membrane protein